MVCGSYVLCNEETIFQKKTMNSIHQIFYWPCYHLYATDIIEIWLGDAQF